MAASLSDPSLAWPSAAYEAKTVQDALKGLFGNDLTDASSAIDIKAFYMGLTGCPWEETSMLYLSPRFLKGQQLPHDALADARLQADLFRKLLAQARGETVQGK